MGGFRLAMGLRDDSAARMDGDVDPEAAAGPGNGHARIDPAIEIFFDSLFETVFGVFGKRIADIDLLT